MVNPTPAQAPRFNEYTRGMIATTTVAITSLCCRRLPYDHQATGSHGSKMVRQLPQVLVYSNGAFGRPSAAPRTAVTWENAGCKAALMRVLACTLAGST